MGSAGEEARRTAAVTAALQSIVETVTKHTAIEPDSCAREHFQERGGNVLRSFRRHLSKHPHQSLPVYGTELVQGHLPPFPLKSHRHPRMVGALDCSHGSDNYSPQMPVHVIG